MPTRRKGKDVGVEREEGPRGWLFPMREATYTKLVDVSAPASTHVPSLMAAAHFESTLQPGAG